MGVVITTRTEERQRDAGAFKRHGDNVTSTASTMSHVLGEESGEEEGSETGLHPGNQPHTGHSDYSRGTDRDHGLPRGESNEEERTGEGGYCRVGSYSGQGIPEERYLF